MENGITNDEFEASYKFIHDLRILITEHCTCDQDEGYGTINGNYFDVICLKCNRKVV